MKPLRALSLSIFFLFLAMGLTSAASLPTNDPFRLEGGLSVDGVSATEDHSFSAYVNGELYKSLETGSEGYYVLTVGGQTGDSVSLSVDGEMVYEDVAFDDYGTYFQNIDLSSSDTGSGDSGSGGGGSSGGSSGSSGGGGGSSSSFHDDEEEEDPFDALLEESSEVEVSAAATDINVVVGEGNATTESEVVEKKQSGLSSITGAFLGGLSDFGLSKVLFVVLALVVVGLAYMYYQKSKKSKESV